MAPDVTPAPSAALTCDVEVRDDAGLRQFRELIDLVNMLDVPVTFFVEYLGGDRGSRREREKVQAMAEGGRHEIGLHIHWRGAYAGGIQDRPVEAFDAELGEAMALAEAAGAPRPVVFRSGGLCCSTAMIHALVARGFRVDSSVAPGLNEPNGWKQGHQRVPHAGWYVPDAGAYARP
ncbi:MAG: polysaccharide deacetylase family protein, partial [Acidobacteriota bacterium]|nr:polysaccharide deacetylase family protein [Acidobacteriota bacterium]